MHQESNSSSNINTLLKLDLFTLRILKQERKKHNWKALGFMRTTEHKKSRGNIHSLIEQTSENFLY